MENKPQSKRKKTIIIAIIVVIVIFLVALVVDTFIGRSYVLRFFAKRNENMQCQYHECQTFGNIKEECVRGPYLENCNYAWQCNDIDNTKGRDKCFSKIGKSKKSKRICNKILDVNMQNSCINYVEEN